MDIFLRDPAFSKIAYLDEFESFIWTERYNSYGDFQMKLPIGSRSNWVQRGSYISHSESHRLMIIEEREETEDADGRQFVLIKGRSLESILDRRVVIPNTANGMTWKNKNTMSEVVTKLVSDICYWGIGMSELDKIPNFYAVNDTTSDTEIVNVAVKPKSLYTATKELCESSKLGFAINILDNQNGSHSLRFSAYEGKVKPNTVFGSLLSNLTNTHRLETDMSYKNLAYVWAKDATYRTIAAPKGGGYSREGLDRRVLMVDASDVSSAEVGVDNILDVLRQRGREALSENRRQEAFDGQLTPDVTYTYNRDYSLGDLVTFRDSENVNHQMRVSEQIWSIDGNGLKTYPTFTTEE